MKVATVGVHVLDTHVIGVESIPGGSDGQLVETIRMSPAGTAGGTAVVHTHAPWSTAVACVLDELPVLHYQQLLLGGAVRVAPCATFGSAELASGGRAALAGRQAALMANHGSVAVGGSLDQAVENALLLEWLAQLHHRASALGTPRPLTDEQQAAVIEAAVRRGYGTTQENA